MRSLASYCGTLFWEAVAFGTNYSFLEDMFQLNRLGDWEQDACTQSDDEPRGDPLVCPLPDLTRFGEPLLVASAGHLLEQVALAQSAVSLMIVIGRSKHWPEEFEFMGKPVDQSTSAEEILNHPGEELGTHCTQIEPDVIPCSMCDVVGVLGGKHYVMHPSMAFTMIA